MHFLYFSMFFLTLGTLGQRATVQKSHAKMAFVSECVDSTSRVHAFSPGFFALRVRKRATVSLKKWSHSSCVTMGRFNPPLSETQARALSVLPHIMGIPSIIGSAFIVQQVLRSPRRRGRIYHRLLCSMSAMDFIFAVKHFLGIWPAPDGTPNAWGAVGTTATCDAAGFAGQGSGLSSILYKGSLTVYFLLTIRFGWSETQIKTLEPSMHVVAMVIGWGTAIAALPLELYNSIGITCWIGGLPPGCTDDCVRGRNAWIYRWAFFHAFLWAIFFFVVVAMIAMYRMVRQQEKDVAKYRVTRRPLSNHHHSRRGPGLQDLASAQFAKQAFFYIAVYFLTWVFPMVQWVLERETGNIYIPIIFLQAILVPMQGFLNALVYVRPRYLKYRREKNNSTESLSFGQLLRNGWKGSTRREREGEKVSPSSIDEGCGTGGNQEIMIAEKEEEGDGVGLR